MGLMLETFFSFQFLSKKFPRNYKKHKNITGSKIGIEPLTSTGTGT